MSGAHHKEENSENDYQNEIDCYTCATHCAYVYIVTDVNDPSGVCSLVTFLVGCGPNYSAKTPRLRNMF